MTRKRIPCTLSSRVIGPSSHSGSLGRVVTLGKIGPMAFFFVHGKCQHYYESGQPSAVSQKFHPTLRTQGIALEGPPKRAGGAVPVANEVLDAGCTKPVGCIARAGEGLALQDAEPDFDLVQPRGHGVEETRSAHDPAEPRATR